MQNMLCLANLIASSLPLYLDPSQPVEARAEDRVGRMNLTEQIAQTWAPYGTRDGQALVDAYADGGAGSFTLGFSGATNPEAILAARNAAQV